MKESQRHDRTNRRVRRVTRLFLAAALAATGCRSTGEGSGRLGILGGERSGNGFFASNHDPLLGKHRIPPQNLPTGQDGTFYSLAESDLPKDPLFRAPSTAVKPAAAKETNVSVPKSETIGKLEPFRPGPAVTTAALAGFSSGNDLVIDDRSPRPASGGPIPLKPLENSALPTSHPPTPMSDPKTGGLTVEMLTEQLRKIGARPYAPVKLTNGDYEFRCAVPINDQGATRSYTGTGASPLAAVRNVYEQIRTDSRP